MGKWAAALAKILFTVAALAFPAVLPSALFAQQIVPVAVGDAKDDDSVTGVFAAPDRNTLRVLNQAQKALDENRFGDALEGLSEILGSNDDSFFQPDRKVATCRSLKAEAKRLLGQMPPEGRRLYEARNGGEARDRLNRAVATGDAALLPEISQRYFHTQAGYEATYLLALHQMDHGAPLAGAMTLKRLREAGPAAEAFEPGLSLTRAACYYQAGIPDDCRQVLVDLKRHLGPAPLKLAALPLAGREVPWFEKESDAPAWLAGLTGLEPMTAAVETERWAMFRGDAARNASTAGRAPFLNRRWRISVTDEPDLEKSLLEQQASYREHHITLFSSLHPLAVGDVVLMRTLSNVLAVDLQTGTRLWQAEEEVVPTEPSDRWNAALVGGGVGRVSQEVQHGRRIWEDATYGTLSSDGSRVFVIEELPLNVGLQNFGTVANALAAYDIRTGKRQWKVGGQDASVQGDTFFLGPPLPLRGQLYVLAEIEGEIRLLALDGGTGKLLWSQQLATVEANVSDDLVRRLAGVSPSYSDGVLICPTAAGCVVAVDPANRSLLWGYIFSRPGEPAMGQPTTGVAAMGRRTQFNQLAAVMNTNGCLPRWLDSCATIVSGRVLLTPAESDELYCLNLADGKPMWAAQPRGEHHYVACVHKGLVVLVGRNTIDAVKLEDGSKAWSCTIDNLPSGAGVCGHGSYAGKQYFLPLSSGEVITIDLESGKIVGRVKSHRSDVPGNLVCYRGRVISQGLDALEVYTQADAARDEAARLVAANPDDIKGLTLRGELLLDAGKPGEAAADFRRVYALDEKTDSHRRTRGLLRDALLAALQGDFAANRSAAGELEPLLDDRTQRAAFFRLMVTGLERSGQWSQAVEYCLKLVDLEQGEPALEEVDDSHLARRDCWVQARLGALRSESQGTGNPGAEAAAQIDRFVSKRLEEATKDPSVDGLKRFLAFFGNQPQALSARAELLKRLTQAGRILDAEMLMAATVDPMDRKAQADLLAEIAELNFRAGRVDDAAACFRLLQREFSDVPCHAGLTPAAWLAAFADGAALRRKVDLSTPAWPVGEVEVKNPEATGPFHVNNRPFPLDMRLRGGNPFLRGGPFLADYHVMEASNQQEVVLRDGTGNLQKMVRPLNAGGISFNPNATLVRSCGHLLLVAAGTKIVALDPWAASVAVPVPSAPTASIAAPDPSGPGRIVWSQDLVEPAPDRGLNTIVANNNMSRQVRTNPFGPVNARYVSFLRSNSIVVADPLTGDLLWTREDIPAGSDVFGDEEFVFILPPGSEEASVYGATDGQLLGTRKVPRTRIIFSAFMDGSEQRSFALSNAGIDFFGRCVLTWQPGSLSEGGVLAFLDPWRQKAVWPSRKFAPGSCVSMVGSEAIGVLEQSGHFVLVALGDGRTIADLQLAVRPQFDLTDLLVARMGDQYIVLASDSHVPPNVIDEPMQTPYGLFCYPLRRARVYALDLNGKLAWPAPVDVDHVQFLLNQPARLPVLLFAAFHYELRGIQTLRTALAAIDRRNGNIVYDKKSATPMPGALGVEIHGDPQTNIVRVLAGNDTVNLHFTDKPVRAMVRQSSDVEKADGKPDDSMESAGSADGIRH